ncbi:hypothetical protein NLX83_00945 [Allokutzneria sp. A3M-2-11 16]|uniref:hypothetical protein n=1 Tax=Allokutzneria sp. A3M-2-11 16 TaxID=2962043 RepID=UPI0020B81809|nr:hypothetical protein [Allokutzneria sp. A3M-2-11 16]MCP3797816.1 hypothetical protein [Allokutzneria sp. A3M-2-11 16]
MTLDSVTPVAGRADTRSIAEIDDPELLAALRTGPFSEALRVAIRRSGLALERVQSRLLTRGVRVSLATLSYWQRGRSRPERIESLKAVELLEEVLRLPPNSLLNLLGPRRPRGRWQAGSPRPLTFDRLWTDHWALERVLDEASDRLNEHVTGLTIKDQYWIGADRTERRVVTSQVLRAERDGIDRVVAIFRGDDPDQQIPSVITVRYGELGRVWSDDESGFLVFEILFDRMLDRGETAVVEYEIDFPEGGAIALSSDRRARYPVREYLLQVHFDPTAVPRRVFEFSRHNAQTPDHVRNELLIGRSGMVHSLHSDCVPGVHGITWEW